MATGSRFCATCGTSTAGAPSPRPFKPPNWWRRRSGLQKVGLILGGIFVALTILGVAVGNQGDGNKNGPGPSTTLAEAGAAVAETTSSVTDDTTTAIDLGATTVSEETTTSAEETTTSTPSGPAKVVASMPASVSRVNNGMNSSRWDYVVTFTETRGVGATITRIGERYLDKSGGVWISEGGEWSDQTIVVDGNGTQTYESWVSSTDGNKGDLRGGTVQVSYAGTDVNGNKFQGKVSAKLAASP
jgi:hypothetical protein